MAPAKGTKPWNAGTSKGWTDQQGYRWLYVTENGRRRARREHRVIMGKHLGRKLEPWELVHHKDGDRSNNSLENLEIVEWGTHTTNHNLGSRKSWETRKTMEAFALMREELKHCRRVQVDLLEALKDASKNCGACGGKGIAYTVEDETELGCSPGSSAIDCPHCKIWRAAIKKAEEG